VARKPGKQITRVVLTAVTFRINFVFCVILQWSELFLNQGFDSINTYTVYMYVHSQKIFEKNTHLSNSTENNILNKTIEVSRSF